MTSGELKRLKELEAEVSKICGDWELGGPYPSVSVITCVDAGCGDGFGECPEPPSYEPICLIHTVNESDAPPPPPAAVLLAEFIAALRNAARDLIVAAERVAELETQNARLQTIVASKLHQRKCHDCGEVFWAADSVTPYCLCEKCGSQDTRLACISFGADPDLKPGPLTQEDRGWKPDDER